MLRSTMRLGDSASMTSMSTTSATPNARTWTRALAPTPRSGPDSVQSRSRWSVKASWLAMTAALTPDASESYADAMRAWWRHISDPSLWPNERLFFEVYGQALQGRAHTEALLDGIVDSWLGPITAMGTARGMSHETAEASARLSIAVTRGLLLDLLATGNRAGVDAAVEHWVELNAAFMGALSPCRRPTLLAALL